MNQAIQLVLASASPRRSEILRSLGLSFEVRPAGIDEEAFARELSAEPRAHVLQLSLAKFDAARDAQAEMLEREHPERKVLIMTADTIVLHGGQILGKPSDALAARRILGRLSGETHEVLTAVCVGRLRASETWLHVARTRVTFAPLQAADIEAYIATGSPFDKAGAYGIQDHSPRFPLIRALEGEYWNVVGLPARLVVQALDHFGASGLLSRRTPDLPVFDPPIDQRPISDDG